jgi:outer membrane lipoprotein LolB
MIRIAAAVLCCAWLAGCAIAVQRPLPADALPLDWPSRREILQGRPDFDLTGRVAIAVGEEGFTGALRWRAREPGSNDLAIDGPLGFGGLRIRSNGADLTLQTSRGERLDGEAARAELERRLGFALPIEALRYWVLGVPQPGIESSESIRGGASYLDGLVQLGWSISYANYQPAGPQGLPGRVTLQRTGARVRLIIAEWVR